MSDYGNAYLQLHHQLLERYGPQHWWPADGLFEMAAGAILTQNTSWRNVEKVLADIRHVLTPEWVLEQPVEALAQAIRSSGFYNRKAETLRAFSAWFRSYGCSVEALQQVPSGRLRRELLDLHGIGFETADSILLYGLDRPYFVVDAYTRRIFSSLGLPVPGSYEAFRRSIEEALPADVALYKEFHALIVADGKKKG